MAKLEEPVVDHEAMINDLDHQLSRLRVLYEQHFLGIEKRPPLIPLKQVVRLIRELETANFRNTSLKFRMRSLVQKFYSYRSYWNRTLREIENGTYKRHRQKLERKVHDELVNQALHDVDSHRDTDRGRDAIDIDVGEVEEMTADDLVAMGMQPQYAADYARPNAHRTRSQTAVPVRGASHEDLQLRQNKLAEIRAKLGLAPESPSAAATPRAPQRPQRQTPQPRAVSQRRPPRRPTGEQRAYSSGALADNSVRSSLSRAGLNENRLRDIYQSLVDAKRRCNQSTAKLTYDNVVRSIAKQAKTVQQKHSASGVDFNVVIRDGRAYLKPQPK